MSFATKFGLKENALKDSEIMTAIMEATWDKHPQEILHTKQGKNVLIKIPIVNEKGITWGKALRGPICVRDCD
ncbi:MAG: hypothetical protein QW331_02595 [Candidatus Woesearchaeota archaeon]